MHGTISRLPELTSLRLTLEDWQSKKELGSAYCPAIDCDSVNSLENLFVDGYAEILEPAFFKGTPKSLRSFGLNGEQVKKKRIGPFWAEIAPLLHRLQLAYIESRIVENFPELRVVEVCNCEKNILPRLDSQYLTHLRVSNTGFNPLEVFQKSILTTVKVLVLESSDNDRYWFAKGVEEGIGTLLKAQSLQRLQLSGFKLCPNLKQRLKKKGVEVFESESLDEVDPDRLFLRPGLAFESRWFSNSEGSNDRRSF